MTDLASLPDLLAAENPIQWAEDHLAFVDAGDTAKLFEHPTEPGVLVRVSDYPDGWFVYAQRLADDAQAQDQSVAEMIERHGPAVLDAAYLEHAEVYVALCERLSPLPDDEEARRLAEIASRVFRVGHPPCLDPDDADELRAHTGALLDAAVEQGAVARPEADLLLERQPGLLTLRNFLTADCVDLRLDNWLMRGSDLVLNDPKRAMTLAEERDYKESKALRAGTPAPAA